MSNLKRIAFFAAAAYCCVAQTQYDLLLQGGHVIDARNKISAVRDVAILDGKIAAVEARIDPAKALKVVNLRGLYVTPGLVNIPVMVDFGANRKERPMSELVTKKLRPGDIYTHCYSGLRNEQDETGHVNKAMFEARKRGVIFDVGHGGGSFAWRIAVPAIKEGFLPDSISTDLHIGSMNSGLKDMLNVMSKFLVMGLALDDVVARSTWNPAREIH